MSSERKILLVEDNHQFYDAAKSYLGSRSVDFGHAVNFESAKLGIERYEFAGVISDLFFPSDTTLEDISLGRVVVDRVLPSRDSKAESVISRFRELGVYDTLTDDAKENIRRFGHALAEDPKMDLVYRALDQVVSLGQEIGTRLLQDNFREGGMLSGRRIRTSGMSMVYRDKLIGAMQRDASNQPLGILVGEMAKERGIPCVFATSTYHHDDLTQPLVNYIARHNLGPVIDCNPGQGNEKTTSAFWERAYTALDRCMEEGK